MLYRSLLFVILSMTISSSLLASYRGLVEIEIESFKCEVGQENRAKLLLKTKSDLPVELFNHYRVFTNELYNVEFCYDLSAFNKFIKEQRPYTPVFLQAIQQPVVKVSPVDNKCSQFMSEQVSIALYNGDPKLKTTKSLPVYASNLVFIKNLPEEECIAPIENDL